MFKSLSCFILAAMLASGLCAQTNSTQKPLVKLDVTIDNHQYSVNEGEPLLVDGKTIIIHTSSFTTFDFGRLSFDYPKNFSFQFEQDYAYKIWTLTGNDFVITYFEFSVKTELGTFVDEIVKKLGKKNCKLEERKIKVGSTDMEGTRINVLLAGTKLTQYIYLIKTNDFKSHIIVFQDTKSEDGSDSKESVYAMDIMNRTFKLK